MEATAPFRFMDLPRDLRLMVYEEIPIRKRWKYLDECRTRAVCSPETTGGTGGKHTCRLAYIDQTTSTAILRVNRQVHNESYRLMNRKFDKLISSPFKFVVKTDLRHFADRESWRVILLEWFLATDELKGHAFFERARRKYQLLSSSDGISSTTNVVVLEIALADCTQRNFEKQDATEENATNGLAGNITTMVSHLSELTCFAWFRPIEERTRVFWYSEISPPE